MTPNILEVMEFGEKLRTWRDRRRMSQSDLADRIGKAQVRVSKWESGTGYPNPGTLLAMSRALRVPVEFLCDDSLDTPEEVAAADQAGAAASGLTDLERYVLSLAREVGVEQAIPRLLGVEGPSARAPRPPAGPEHHRLIQSREVPPQAAPAPDEPPSAEKRSRGRPRNPRPKKAGG